MKHYALSLLLFAFLPYLNDLQAYEDLRGSNTVKASTLNTDGPNLLRLAPDVNMLDADDCFGHGGSVGGGISWNIATCKSHCTKGLGFRCGGETYQRCADGTIVITSIRDDSCPHDKSRLINADMNFYDNNTLTFIFLSALPEEEHDNNDFEVEEEVIIKIPEYLLIGDHHYSSFTIKKGIYTVNRLAGEFGEVTVDITLNK
jgi:hypothetical protein